MSNQPDSNIDPNVQSSSSLLDNAGKSTGKSSEECGGVYTKRSIKPTIVCPTASTRAKHDNPVGFNQPSEADAKKIFLHNLDCGRVMPDEVRHAIDSDFTKAVKKPEDRQIAYLKLALALADAGSSPEVNIVATVNIGNETLNLSDLVNIIKMHCTLRQFARFYAKIVYNHMRVHNRPPDNWLGKGYTEPTKYAAYDFFDATSSPEAMEPITGMRFRPTYEEIVAHNTNKAIQLNRRAREEAVSTLVEITRGQTNRNVPAIRFN